MAAMGRILILGLRSSAENERFGNLIYFNRKYSENICWKNCGCLHKNCLQFRQGDKKRKSRPASLSMPRQRILKTMQGFVFNFICICK